MQVLPDGTTPSRGGDDENLNLEVCRGGAGSNQIGRAAVAWQGNPEYIGQGRCTQITVAIASTANLGF